MGWPDSTASTQTTSFEAFPFETFTRDFETLMEAAGEKSPETERSPLVELPGYVQRVYADPLERRRRGAALAMCFSFVANHLEDPVFKRHVVKGARGSLFSEAMFRAVYEIVAGFALDPARLKPTPQAVRARADQLTPRRPFSVRRLLGMPRYG